MMVYTIGLKDLTLVNGHITVQLKVKGVPLVFLQLILVKLFTKPHYWEIILFEAEEKEGKLIF